jgi:hypothetical protein
LNAEIADHTRASRPWSGPGDPSCSAGPGGPDRGRHCPKRLVPRRPLPDRCRLRHARRRPSRPPAARRSGCG